MPSSDDIIAAIAQVKQWAIEQLIKEGHAEHSAKAIAQAMTHDQRIEVAERLRGPIYRGPYSPY